MEALAFTFGLTAAQLKWIFAYFSVQMEQPFFKTDMTDREVAVVYEKQATNMFLY